MRLLNAYTLQIEEFRDRDTPKYAILSHTWCGDEEVTFQDIQGPNHPRHKPGYDKILQTCRLALRDGLQYAWVDTCCIDRSNSGEVSEAINSMMSWYARAEICYAYLIDVPPGTDFSAPYSHFRESLWFTRGWTLQELVAPPTVAFLYRDWTHLATRDELARLVSEITGIDEFFLTKTPGRIDASHGGREQRLRARFNAASVAERMSWASRRRTTRPEDVAYSLLGIFGIRMSLLYGEGGTNAFLRLQEEIMRRSDDQSILSWQWDDQEFAADFNEQALESFSSVDEGEDTHPKAGLLASSPAAFARCKDAMPCDVDKSTPLYSISNKGLQIELPFDGRYALLQCTTKHSHGWMLAIPLVQIGDNQYARVKGQVRLVPSRKWLEWPSTRLHLLPSLEFMSWTSPSCIVMLRGVPNGFRVADVEAPGNPRVDLDSRLIMEFKSRRRSYKRRIAQVLLAGNSRSTKPLVALIECTRFLGSYSVRCYLAELCEDDYELGEPLATDGKRKLVRPDGLFTINWSCERYFNQSIFSIDIVQTANVPMKSIFQDSLDFIRRLREDAWYKHPVLPVLHEQWANKLTRSYFFSLRAFCSVLKTAVLLPWMFTFLLEYTVMQMQKVANLGAKHTWKYRFFYAPWTFLCWASMYHPAFYGNWRRLAKLLKIAAISRTMYNSRRQAGDLFLFYLCCKALPAECLTFVIKNRDP